MHTYTIISPRIEGLLSHDSIYFEGINKPEEFFIIRDGGTIPDGGLDILDRYFNDIHNLFLRKLEEFYTDIYNDENNLKLQALLQEMIKVKKMIENAHKEDIIEE